MRTPSERDEAMALAARGFNSCEIARRTGIPRTTIRDWRTGRIPRGGASHVPDLAKLPRSEYAYLLGMYLGDGYIVEGRRSVYTLRIYLDSRYPGILFEVCEALEAVMPGKRAHRALHPTAAMVIISMHSKHWPRLFPQHGAGRKHERPIVLSEWQQAIVAEHQGKFLRGLIHSDGCRHMNRVYSAAGKPYEYWRYEFSNASDDIRTLFTDSCEALGIEWRRMNARNISVARRESVAKLDAFVGAKR